jgi:hypothetical protein
LKHVSDYAGFSSHTPRRGLWGLGGARRGLIVVLGGGSGF